MSQPTPPSFRCPKCTRESYNPNDARYGYCGACHSFTGQPDPNAPPVDPETRTDQMGEASFMDLIEAAKTMGDTSQLALIALTGEADEMLSPRFAAGLTAAILQDRVIIILRTGRDVIVPRHLARIAAEVVDWTTDPILYAERVMEAIAKHCPTTTPR